MFIYTGKNDEKTDDKSRNSAQYKKREKSDTNRKKPEEKRKLYQPKPSRSKFCYKI